MTYNVNGKINIKLTQIHCSPLIILCFIMLGAQRNGPCLWSLFYNSFVKFHGKSIWEQQHDHVIYPNPYYIDVFYKGIALYIENMKQSTLKSKIIPFWFQQPVLIWPQASFLWYTIQLEQSQLTQGQITHLVFSHCNACQILFFSVFNEENICFNGHP